MTAPAPDAISAASATAMIIPGIATVAMACSFPIRN
jgi:hypothetical protein